MPKQKSDLRILLLQIRDEPHVRREEHESFADHSGLSNTQIDILNTFDTPAFSSNSIDGYDALFVGGASEASVLEPATYPFLGSAESLLLYCIEQEIPVFASCFGFQLAVVALGGTIIRDENDFEMGTIPIRLADAAKADPLFQDTSDNFLAVSVHRERTLSSPEGCETLAYTKTCCHAFKIKEKPFWGFQFHPEVDRQRLVERLTVYREQYTKNDGHLEQILASVSETPESNVLVQKFVERILLK